MQSDTREAQRVFQCCSCGEQGYDGEDSSVPNPSELCPFHTSVGPHANRENYPRWSEGLKVGGATVTPIDPHLRGIRTDMSPEEAASLILDTDDRLEQGCLIWRIHQVTGMTLEKISDICGKGGNWGSVKSRLGRLVPQVLDMIRQGELQFGMSEFLGVAPEEYQETLAREIMQRDLTLAQARTWVPERLRRLQQGGKQTETGPEPEDTETDTDIAQAPSGAPEAEGTIRLILHSLGQADRLMSAVGDLTFRDLMNAFQTPEDLRAARSHLLTTAHRLDELERFLEHIRAARFPTMPGIRRSEE